ncbi:MAG: hypothetical protein ABIJ59_20515 [Pseudomonadota bacterium]
MITTSLTIVWFFGFVYASNRWLKIELCHAPLFSISLVGIILFIFGISNALKSGTHFVLFTGFFLFSIGTTDYWKNRQKQDFSESIRMMWIIAGLILVSFVLTIGMKLKIDDDYVYWGIIGKYLNFYHHLPDQETTIIRQHLAYTPGTSIVHYLVYQLAGQYNPALSYFAQNLFLISALCVVFFRQTIKKGGLLLFLLIVLMTIFSGSVFTRLPVDHLLSIYFFAVLWIILKEKPTSRTLFSISLPCCFLFLIKEIGLVMGIVLLLVFLIDLAFYKKIEVKAKLRTMMVFCLCAGLLFALKQAWTEHCLAMGFSQFSNGVNWESIQKALHVFSNEGTQRGFLLFIKELFIGSSDRLNLPYICWYMALIFLFMQIQTMQEQIIKKRFVRIVMVFLFALLIYLVMLYCLQIIVFGVGVSNDHIIGFARYMNILFSPMVFFFVLLYADKKLSDKTISNKFIFSSLIAVLLLLGFSRVETSLRREKHYQEAQVLAEKIETSIDISQTTRIGVIPGTGDNDLWIRLLYHLLPARINQGRFPADNQEMLLKNINQYDYLLFYHPGQKIIDWVNPLLNDGFKNQGLYRVEQKDDFQNSDNKNRLDNKDRPDSNKPDKHKPDKYKTDTKTQLIKLF